MRAGIALGSNLGDRLGHLRAARERIAKVDRIEPPILASSVYETDAVGCEPGAPKFLNAVVEVGYDGDALTLLRKLRQIEADLGRSPAHARNTSRTIDLDLLYLGDTRISTAELQLPHPRMHERRFVLEPLADIRPDHVLPGQTEIVRRLLQQLGATEPLVRFASEW